MKVVFTYRSCKKKEKTGGSQVNYTFLHGSFPQHLHYLEMFCDCRIIMKLTQLKGFFFASDMNM